MNMQCTESEVVHIGEHFDDTVLQSSCRVMIRS